MILLLASLALSGSARADSITLDTGATIEGDLARYEFGGDCQLSVTEGDLTGVILIVPCHRVQSFVRTAVRTPVPIGLPTEGVAEEVVPVASDAALQPPVDAPEASVAVGAAAGAVPVAEEDAPFYDEPLFPSDPTAPIGIAAPTERGATASSEPVAAARPSAATPSVAAPSMAPVATPAESGPRMAPRMDELPPATERRAVSF